MSETITMDTAGVPVPLTAPGFRGAEVAAPSFAVERSLRSDLLRPGGADARSFVTQLLAGCLTPRRTVWQVEALGESNRARLRRGLVKACGEQARWRALYGTHLSGDERLLATMVWRQRRHAQELKETISSIAARRSELSSTAFARISEAASVQIAEKLVGYHFGLVEQAERVLASYRSVTQPYLALAKGAHFGMPAAYANAFSASKLTAAARIDRHLGFVGVGNPAWLKAITSVDSGLGVAAAGQRLLEATNIAERYSGLAGLPSLTGIAESLTRPFQHLAQGWAGFEEVDRFIETWERDALWLLFAKMHVGATRGLASLTRSEVEAIVLDALEPICSNAKYTAALRAEVAKAPYLSSSQREHLDHMLEHAERREYVKASGSLYFGLEGAYREAAYASTPLARPSGTKKALGFEKIVKLMALPAELQTFIVRAVFGGTGNTIRHGNADGVERRQVLMGIVALAGWLELFAGEPALELLADYLGATLPRAIERAQTPVLVVGG